MATTNQERIGKALELLLDGLTPFVRRQMKARYGPNWEDDARQTLSERGGWQRASLTLDVQALFTLLEKHWHEAFKGVLGQAERNYISELREVRNRWAHQDTKGFSSDDLYRALDSIGRLLTAVSAPQAKEIEVQKQESLRLRYEEQARNDRRKSADLPMGMAATGNCRAWREVITPHPDVAKGVFTQAEFAASLDAVHSNEQCSPEYGDPQQFFQRTYMTGGINYLLKNALTRTLGKGGDPVVELQTNFGGGKTHAMIALYHLFCGKPATELPQLEQLLADHDIERIPADVHRAVLVGFALPPGQTRPQADGVVVHTLWGELAWQLGGAAGYGIVAQSDQNGTNPGSHLLQELLQRYSPCLILIDEWVTHLRQLTSDNHLPAGSFEANLSFAQSLTEAVKLVPKALLVASLPKSDIETGGDQGILALDRLRNIFGRIESAWRPASTEEGFEIVRRRLFEPITEREKFTGRDNTIKEFIKFYRAQSKEFPSECSEAAYEKRMQLAYPIHPELFDRLYEDWSTLDKFQRTRGVLRLMASVIHELWKTNDQSPLIMPCHVPLGNTAVQGDLLRYLDDRWLPVLEKDIEGASSLAAQLDGEKTNLGRYAACRRVARTIFVGSAPTSQSRNVGLDQRNIRLGSVQPNDPISVFNDGLSFLADHATYLYAEHGRYWFSTQPSVLRLAQDRAQQWDNGEVWSWLRDEMRKDRERGGFPSVHNWPEDTALIPDEESVRLVILGTQTAHKGKNTESEAMKQIREILARRGSSPRLNQNMVLFVAADQEKVPILERAIREHLAWQSISADAEQLNLTPHQASQTKTKAESAKQQLTKQIADTYRYLLTPDQKEPLDPKTLEIEEHPLATQSNDALAIRASLCAKQDGLFATIFAGSLLRMTLDDFSLWTEGGGNHVTLKKLWEYFARYPYLPRLRDQEVLLKAVRDGVAQKLEDNFAYAERWDGAKNRYINLKVMTTAEPILDGESVLVHPEAAQRQREAEEAKASAERAKLGIQEGASADGYRINDGMGGTSPREESQTPRSISRHFRGIVELESLRATRDFGRIMDEIITHLLKAEDSIVKLTVEINAELPNGADEQLKRTVIENANTLKLTHNGFE